MSNNGCPIAVSCMRVLRGNESLLPVGVVTRYAPCNDSDVLTQFNTLYEEVSSYTPSEAAVRLRGFYVVARMYYEIMRRQLCAVDLERGVSARSDMTDLLKLDDATLKRVYTQNTVGLSELVQVLSDLRGRVAAVSAIYAIQMDHTNASMLWVKTLERVRELLGTLISASEALAEYIKNGGWQVAGLVGENWAHSMRMSHYPSHIEPSIRKLVDIYGEMPVGVYLWK